MNYAIGYNDVIGVRLFSFEGSPKGGKTELK